MKKNWRLTVEGSFSAGHAINHYEGKCERLHGHNFTVRITVQGHEVDSKTGMLLDFKIIRTALRDVLDRLDHQILNETPPFDRISPSSENLAEFIWKRMNEKLAPYLQDGTSLSEVAVSEKPGQEAAFLGF